MSGKWDDGYTEWFLTWKQLLKGSATHEAVQVSTTGSTFVNPDTLPSHRVALAGCTGPSRTTTWPAQG